MLSFSHRLTARNQLMARALTERGWRVDAVAWFRGQSLPAPPSAGDLEKLGVHRWHWIHLPVAKKALTLSIALPRLYRRMRGCLQDIADVDLCLLNHAALLPIVPRLPGRVVYDASERWVITVSSAFGWLESPVRPIIAKAERLLCRRVSAITTMDSPGDWLAAHYRKTGKPVVVLRNVPSLDDDPLPTAAATRAGTTLAYVGGIDADRGMRIMLEAIASVQRSHADVGACLIGPSKRWEVDVQPLIAHHGLEDVVRLCGYLPYRDAVQKLTGADIGLALYQPSRLTYHFAGAGNARKILTYMHAGLPVIGPEFGALGDIVRQYDCGVLVDTTDAAAIAAAIVKLLEAPEERARLGANGRRAIAGELNWQRERRQFDELVESLV